MLDFSHCLNLPLIWGALIATAIVIYVLLDGFDLGVGILFPFAPSDPCRDRMMMSIAPFWDSNETWLILGGAGLFVAFPLAYAIIMPAFYIPIILMMLCLIFRGVAFEFRFKAKGKSRRIWDYAFHFGSLGATLMQGIMLGAYVQGIHVEGRAFAGNPFDWLTAFSVMTGIAVIIGYGLLGSTWLIIKTTDQTQDWAYQVAKYLLTLLCFFLALVSIWVPFLNERILHIWFSVPNIYYLSLVPLATVACVIGLYIALNRKKEVSPYFYTIALFLLCFLGLAISIWPWIVPYQVTLTDAANAGTSLSITLIGVVVALPAVLGYTGYCYYVFRGKSSHDEATYR